MLGELVYDDWKKSDLIKSNIFNTAVEMTVIMLHAKICNDDKSKGQGEVIRGRTFSFSSEDKLLTLVYLHRKMFIFVL